MSVDVSASLSAHVSRRTVSASAGADVEDQANRVRRQLRLRQEPDRRTLGDEIPEVGLRMRRDQDHRRPAVADVLDQVASELETAVPASMMSTRATSGWSSPAFRSASAAVEQTPTTDTPSRSRRTRAASRNDRLSSTIRTRKSIPPDSQDI